MNNRIFAIAVLGWSLASAGHLPAQDNRNSNTRQPTLEDQLEQNDQNAKGQVDPQAPPAARRSGESGRSTHSAEVKSREPGGQQSYDVFYQGLQSGGHWFENPTYGEVWQPDVAASEGNWRPYSDGH